MGPHVAKILHRTFFSDIHLVMADPSQGRMPLSWLRHSQSAFQGKLPHLVTNFVQVAPFAVSFQGKLPHFSHKFRPGCATRSLHSKASCLI
jgi:hypothetical protein